MSTGLGQYFANTTINLMNEINTPIEGSYMIIFPRLYNLSYAQFLRMVRDIYGAVLVKGNNTKYIYFYFKEKSKCDKFVKEVNNRFIKWRRRK